MSVSARLSSASGADRNLVRVERSEDGVTFPVKVHPKAKRERISGLLGDALKLEITAPPINGRANYACISFFSKFLKVPRSSVTIAAGLNSRNKVIRITGISADAVERAFVIALEAKDQKREEGPPQLHHDLNQRIADPPAPKRN